MAGEKKLKCSSWWLYGCN